MHLARITAPWALTIALLAATSACTPSESPPSVASVDEPEIPVAVPPSPQPAAQRYDAEGLDRLLALVPEDAMAYVAVRDPAVILDGIGFALDVERPSIMRLVETAHEESPIPAMTLRRLVEGYPALREVLATQTQLDRGLLVVGRPGGLAWLVYAEDPRALQKGLARALPATTQCVSVNADVVACSERPRALEGIAPADAAAHRRDELAALLGDVDLSSANVVATMGGGHAITVSTPSGRLELHAGPVTVPAPVHGQQIAGEAKALELVAPNTTFVWNRVATAAVLGAPMPAPVREIVSDLEGEGLLAATADPVAVVLLLSARDTASFTSTLPSIVTTLRGALKGSGIDEIELGMTNVVVDGKEVPVAHGRSRQRITGDPTQVGLVPEAYAFATDRWLVTAIGADRRIVDEMYDLRGTGASPELLASLPEELARVLEANEAILAAHFALDALHAEKVRKLAGEVLEEDATEVLSLVELLAPVSSVSLWMTDAKPGPQMHATVRFFADAHSEAGHEAAVALRELAAGSSRARTYADLARRFPDAPNAHAYRVRAGQDEAAIGSLVALVTAVSIAAAFVQGA